MPEKFIICVFDVIFLFLVFALRAFFSVECSANIPKLFNRELLLSSDDFCISFTCGVSSTKMLYDMIITEYNSRSISKGQFSK